MSNILSTEQQKSLESRLVAEQQDLRGRILRKMNELDRDELNRLSAKLQQQPEDGDWGILLAGAGWPEGDSTLQRLLLVEASLALIEQEMYGICSDCEGDINVDLLLEDPARQRCAPCQAKYERRDHSRQFLVL